MFKLTSSFKPAGDQPAAIEKLTRGISNQKQHQILLGVTGSGKTFTIANVIANLNKPTLIIAHNKTLAAQLYTEFLEFFPNNAVEYFISYYDYYQPEAYIPSRDAYIEKEADINEEIEKLRHSATRSLLTRKDVIIIASVSCIYGLGMPEDYLKGVLNLKTGQTITRFSLLNHFNHVQYERNDIELKRGRYRVKGETIDIFPSWEDHLIRVEFFGDEIDRLSTIHPVTGNVLSIIKEIDIFPASHYVVNRDLEQTIVQIKNEMLLQKEYFIEQGKLFEAKRIEQRTLYDIEMLAEMGYCKGIENYARHISGRPPGSPPGVLIDFFPDDFLLIIDESHATIPQIGGMYNGDKARKTALVDYGFRLPSAIDNRPLKFEEFEDHIKNVIHISATPGNYELNKCKKTNEMKIEKSKEQSPWDKYDIVEQLIRPTGLVDPEIELRTTKNQVDYLLEEIIKRTKKQERVLITTLTKKNSEDLTDFLQKKSIKVNYLHSEISALDRVDILYDLRKGKYDVLVGVNLLREGLDLPEVSLVAIMEADKEGFLRNERSLIQTMGRAARNINGKVILFADKVTQSMEKAINETNRRRNIQLTFNKEHNIVPKTIIKKLTELDRPNKEKIKELKLDKKKITADKLPNLLKTLEKEMKTAAKNLEFELAAVIRDQIEELKNTKVN